MEMAKMAGKCVAVLCALAVIAPAAASAPVCDVFAENVITASADSDQISKGDQYVPVGDTFTLRELASSVVESDYTIGDYTLQWYYSDDQTGRTANSLNWTPIPGANSLTYSATMTSQMNCRNFRLGATNKQTGEETFMNMSTVCCTRVKTKLGVPAVETDGEDKWVAIPLYMDGFIDNKVSTVSMKMLFDKNIYDQGRFDCEIGLFGPEEFWASKGEYGCFINKIEPVEVGSDKLIGTFYFHVREGVDYGYENTRFKIEFDNVYTIGCGSEHIGNLYYGTAAVSTTVPVSKKENPTCSLEANSNSIKFTWNRVIGAEGYGIMGYADGKWKTLATCDANASTYTLGNLKPSTSYKVCVVAKYNGKWNADVSKALTIKTAAAVPPSLKVTTGNGKFEALWSKVSGAAAYALACSKTGTGSWKQIGTFGADTVKYTSPEGRTPKGTYYICVAAKIGGTWVKSPALKITIQ